jgi:hypothetical protein
MVASAAGVCCSSLVLLAGTLYCGTGMVFLQCKLGPARSALNSKKIDQRGQPLNSKKIN